MQRFRQLQAELVRRANRLRRDKSGIAAIEFAMIVPIMVMLFFGTVEFSQALTVDRRVAQIASTTADLVAQYDTISTTQVDNIFTVAASLVMPYDQPPLKISVTNLKKTGTAAPTGTWSRPFQGATTYAGSYGGTVPPGLLDDQAAGVSVCVVMSEVKYHFVPTIGQWLTAGVDLSEKFYLKPRKSNCVDLTVG